MSLDDRVTVVTGASQGIGQGVALRMARTGSRIAILDRQPAEETTELLTQQGADWWQYEVDIAEAGQVAEAFSRMENEFGVPYALVNAAGVFADKPFLDTPVEVWDRVLAVNARGAFLTCQEAGRRMRDHGGGRIVNILSTAAAQGFAQETAYCASKGAALLLTRTLAVEFAQYGITVNGVGPGTVETPMGGDYLGDGPIAGHELARTPLGRFGQPADIAEAVAFFIGGATWVTGQALYVDGGFLAAGLPLLKGM
ncbi:SDR family NAD(P)-dependent oxidoreductase [Streptomyces iranensis]|uniref:NAD(P)-dependent dehydrogenase (Short-subunit alcohol dehydrogenase family) n=1 Tax=Streptomyces iranensis TaxID=576784 RepID=A0A060ZTQ7_9ACTN|nr:SDR family NAD(P)-dependent oxidoreductase [Streptomyces iranensis]MBP2060966.1 NAD(P)-dependent dehydrogenase (short-subunit alcohol dehydrogenase family) [Streptomyces iranensis]CDR06437.1 short-chain dehydrogenase/reductase SDR [Streptomyces iranensis]